MKIGRRISMASLNNNIDADLIFGTASTYHSVRASGRTNICLFKGGDQTQGSGAFVHLRGADFGSGAFVLYTPNAAKDADVAAIQVVGDTDTPYLELLAHRIGGIADPTTAQDALTYKPWATWTPTKVWATADPSAITTVAQWVQIGKTVFWHLYITSADSNATTGLTATLPVMPANIASYSMPRCVVLNNVTRVDPFGYITHNGAEQRLQFAAFPTCVDGATVTVYASGEYPVA